MNKTKNTTLSPWQKTLHKDQYAVSNLFIEQWDTLKKAEKFMKVVKNWKNHLVINGYNTDSAIPFAYLNQCMNLCDFRFQSLQKQKKFVFDEFHTLQTFELMIKNGLKLDDFLLVYNYVKGRNEKPIIENHHFGQFILSSDNLNTIIKLFNIILKIDPEQINTFFAKDYLHKETSTSPYILNNYKSIKILIEKNKLRDGLLNDQPYKAKIIKLL